MSIRRTPKRALNALALGLGVFTAGVGHAHASNGGPANVAPPKAVFSTPIQVRPNAFGISQPVRSFQAAEPVQDASLLPILRAPRNPSLRVGIKGEVTNWGEPDGALTTGGRAPFAMPPTIVNIEGLSNLDNAALQGGTLSPPDTVGDIGRTHYVQAVNIVMRIFNLDGSPATPAFKMSALFSSLGPSNACANDDDGDPIILFDHLANRWLVTQFATDGPPHHQCIAISTTPDPTGSYYVYDFLMPVNKFNDYPHLGVWPDGYYMTDNQFNFSTSAFLGAGVFAFDRRRLLRGDPDASFIYFDLFGVDSGLGGMLPSDLDGPPPPAGTPNTFAMYTANELGDPGGDGIRLWEFRPDYETPANSTFTELTSQATPLAVAPFDALTPPGRADIPQPGGASVPALDTIGDRILHRLQYRWFGTHGSLVANHSVDVSGNPTAGVFRAGVRYYELRKSGSAPWTVHDQATHGPADTTNRWMASAALDRAGNLGVGFSASNATDVFPSIWYGGRLVSDPVNGGLTQGEAVLVAGGRSQLSTGNRWGDYSSLNVSPVDDCTFWFTSEYYVAPAPAACGSIAACWQTRIGSFRFPSCASAPADGTVTGTVTNGENGAPVPGAWVSAGNGYLAITDATGTYSLLLPPQTIDVSATAPTYDTDTETAVVVPAGGTVTRNFVLNGVPTLAIDGPSFSDDVTGGNDNGVIDVQECPVITAPATNEGGASAVATVGEMSTLTPGVTVTQANASYGTIAPGATATHTPLYVIRTDAGFQPGTPVELAVELTSGARSWIEAFRFPSGSPSATSAPFSSTAAAVPIPDNNATGAAMPVVVAGLTSRVSKVTVAVRGTHPFQGDISLALEAPNGQRVGLVNSIGGASSSAANFGTDCPAGANDLVFDDAAASLLTTGGANRSGTFRPVQPLSTFTGVDGNGTWRLRAIDSGAQDIGTIDCVTVTINGHTSTSGGCNVVLPDPMFQDGFENP